MQPLQPEPKALSVWIHGRIAKPPRLPHDTSGRFAPLATTNSGLTKDAVIRIALWCARWPDRPLRFAHPDGQSRGPDIISYPSISFFWTRNRSGVVSPV
jgi:hypothetical protein